MPVSLRAGASLFIRLLKVLGPPGQAFEFLTFSSTSSLRAAAREYVGIQKAREALENSKARFVDDPSGALAEARRAVGQALETRGYPPPERANEAPQTRQEILQEYRSTDMGDTGRLEDMRDAYIRLSDLLDRLTRT